MSGVGMDNASHITCGVPVDNSEEGGCGVALSTGVVLVTPREIPKEKSFCPQVESQILPSQPGVVRSEESSSPQLSPRSAHNTPRNPHVVHRLGVTRG